MFITSVQLSQSVMLQHQSFQRTLRTDFLEDGLVGSPCSPRDSQESSPTPQCKCINSSVLSFLYNPTLTSVHSVVWTQAKSTQRSKSSCLLQDPAGCSHKEGGPGVVLPFLSHSNPIL